MVKRAERLNTIWVDYVASAPLQYRPVAMKLPINKNRDKDIYFPMDTKEQHTCQQTDLYPTPGVFYQATVICRQSMDQRNPLVPRNL